MKVRRVLMATTTAVTLAIGANTLIVVTHDPLSGAPGGGAGSAPRVPIDPAGGGPGGNAGPGPDHLAGDYGSSPKDLPPGM